MAEIITWKTIRNIMSNGGRLRFVLRLQVDKEERRFFLSTKILALRSERDQDRIASKMLSELNILQHGTGKDPCDREADRLVQIRKNRKATPRYDPKLGRE